MATKKPKTYGMTPRKPAQTPENRKGEIRVENLEPYQVLEFDMDGMKELHVVVPSSTPTPLGLKGEHQKINAAAAVAAAVCHCEGALATEAIQVSLKLFPSGLLRRATHSSQRLRGVWL